MEKTWIHWLRAIFSELERGIFSPAFGCSAAATAAVLFLGSTSLWFPSEEALASGLSWDYDWTMLDTGCKSEAFIFCLPLMAAFPAALSVLTDLRSGFIKSYLGRCGLRPYIVSKVILSAVSGGGSIFFGYMGAAGLMFMIYGPLEQAPPKAEVSLDMEALSQLLSGEENGLAVSGAAPGRWEAMWPQALVVFLAGALFAMLAAILGLLFGSRYMAFGGAFMVSYVLIILTERFLSGLYTLNPREWFRQEHYWEGGYMGCAGFLLELSVLMALCYGQIIFRKIMGGSRR